MKNEKGGTMDVSHLGQDISRVLFFHTEVIGTADGLAFSTLDIGGRAKPRPE
jgi:hypothetical protein